AGPHWIVLDASSASGRHAQTTTTIEACVAERAPTGTWAQLGGDPAHTGAVARELVPPLATRWAQTVGGHVITASPVVANGIAVVVTTDLADGDTGAVVALDAATGVPKWRA